jgi:hypothetical protein
MAPPPIPPARKPVQRAQPEPSATVHRRTGPEVLPAAPIETPPDSDLTVDGLPLRMPGQSLSPHLRDESGRDTPRSGPYAMDHRSADQIEELFAGFPTREES